MRRPRHALDAAEENETANVHFGRQLKPVRRARYVHTLEFMKVRPSRTGHMLFDFEVYQCIDSLGTACNWESTTENLRARFPGPAVWQAAHSPPRDSYTGLSISPKNVDEGRPDEAGGSCD